MHRLAFLLILLGIGQLHAAELKSVRTQPQAEGTQVVFELSGQTEFHVFTMTNPNRVVVDFLATRTQRTPMLVPDTARGIRGLRSALRGSDGIRVVLDLTAPMQVASSTGVSPSGASGDTHHVTLDLVSRPARPKPPAPAEPAAIAHTQPTPAALQRVALAPAPPINASPRPDKRELVIAIDAGHGGEDVGAIGAAGTYEKDIALAVAREMARLINTAPGMRAVLTRDGDYFVKLRTRMERARAHKADLFISIHADAFRNRSVRGSSVFVLSQRGASSEAAKFLAENENAADFIGGVSLDDKDRVLKSVLLDLSQTASIEASIELGNHVLSSLKRLGVVHRKRVEHAGFMVLKSPDIPSILVETAFISNPSEEKKLRDAGYRKQIATAIFRGMAGYFGQTAPPDTRLADNHSHRVSRGETLSGIADRYEVSMGSIKLANNMRSEMVRAGETLRIP